MWATFLLITLTTLYASPLQWNGDKPVNPKNLSRIIALAPDTADFLMALNLQTKLVGIASPPANQELVKLPSVGNFTQPNLEKIIQLKPQLVLTTIYGNPEPLVKRLTGLSVPSLTLNIKTVADLEQALEELGDFFERQKEAQVIRYQLRRSIKNLTGKFSGRILFQIQGSPLISASGDTFFGDLLQKIGFQVIPAGGKFALVTPEEIFINPPHIVLIPIAVSHMERRVVFPWNQWSKLAVVQKKQIILVPESPWSRPSPKILEALAMLQDFKL